MEKIELLVTDNKKPTNNLNAIISKLGNLSNITGVNKKPNNAFTFMVKSNEYFIPLSDNINLTEEIKKLQKELDYTKGFLKSVEGKLNNKKFINNAPDQVVSNEQNKMADAKSKIKILENKISDFKK